jgi:hypothetical protein
MNKTTEALKLAEEALVYHTQQTRPIQKTDEALAAIREVLAEPVKQEPVAWLFQHEETGRTMCVDVQQVQWNFEKNNPRLQKIHPLYAAPVDAKAIREAALEEAAKVCDGWPDYDVDGLAEVIRGLK